MNMLSNFLRSLTGQKNKTSAPTPQNASITLTKSNGAVTNRGTRFDTLKEASNYWLTRMTSPKKDPFLLYKFDTEASGRAALLAVPCIQADPSTGKLLCTETLLFGCYSAENGTYEAFLCGDDLTYELWEQAKASFIKHGGQPKGQGELAPERGTAAPKAKPKAEAVTFVREDRNESFGVVGIYRVYRGPNAASAQAFLERNPVTKPYYYLVVETPEGNYCRDSQGMYKE